MYLLDTNALSEFARPTPNQGLIDFLDALPEEVIFTTVFSVNELWVGLHRLPDGKRKQTLTTTVTSILRRFEGRTLSFLQADAEIHAKLHTDALQMGRVVSIPDGYIGAMAYRRQFAMVSRDTVPYESLGVRVHNPWS